jgi:hypothetical protein
MRHALLACWLLGCTLDTKLGDHRSSQPAPEAQAPRAADGAGDAAPLDAAERQSPPSSEPAAAGASADDGTPGDGAEPAADESEPPADVPDMPDGDGEPEAPMEEPPMGEPPADGDAPADQPACDTATDNPCRLCDQDACCAPRSACLENAACACHLECRGAEDAAACREACDPPGERYEPWLACLREHCADRCEL